MRQNIAALSLKRFEMKFNEMPHVIICVKLYLGSQGAFRGSGETTGQMPAPVWEDHCLLWLSFLRRWKLRFVCFSPSNNKNHSNLQRKLRGQLNWPRQTLFEKSSESDQRLPRLHIPQVGLYAKKTIESQNKKLRFSAWLQRLEDTLVSFLASLSWTPRTFSKSFVLLAKIFSHGDLLRLGVERANYIKTKTKTNKLCKSQT